MEELSQFVEINNWDEQHGEIVLKEEGLQIIHRLITMSDINMGYKWNNLRIWLHSIVIIFISLQTMVIYFSESPIYSALALVLLLIYSGLVARLYMNLQKEQDRINKAREFINERHPGNTPAFIPITDFDLGFRYVNDHDHPDDFLKEFLYKNGCLDDADFENIGLDDYQISIVSEIEE